MNNEKSAEHSQLKEMLFDLKKKNILDMWEKQKKANVELFDYEESIMQNAIPIIAEVLKSLGVYRFTISVQQSSMQELLYAFSKVGYQLKGLVKIKNRLYDVNPDYCDETKDAFLLELEY